MCYKEWHQTLKSENDPTIVRIFTYSLFQLNQRLQVYINCYFKNSCCFQRSKILFTPSLSDRMWAESQPGPSKCQPSRQGYCGYCRILYSNLDQVQTPHTELRSCVVCCLIRVDSMLMTSYISSLSTCPVSNTWTLSGRPPEAPAPSPPPAAAEPN